MNINILVIVNINIEFIYVVTFFLCYEIYSKIMIKPALYILDLLEFS